MATLDNGLPLDPGLEGSTTASPGGNSSGDSTVVIVAVVVVVVLFLAACGIGIWVYRRKTGQWPKPFRRSHSNPVSRNPFGSKSYAKRWQKSDSSNGLPTINTHRADFREPIPRNGQSSYSISEKISEHLFEASEKVSREQRRQASNSSTRHKNSIRIQKENSQRNSRSTRKSSIRNIDSSIGIYQDRTLPASLMMTVESQKLKFSDEGRSLRRSNSATLHTSSQRRSVGGSRKGRRPSAGSIHLYNDFGPYSNIGKYGTKRKNLKTVSQISSKPSITSDYVSDAEASTMGRKEWGKRKKDLLNPRATNQQKRVSDCDSMLQDQTSAEKHNMIDIDEGELEQALQADNLSLAALHFGNNMGENISKLVTKLDENELQQDMYDDRTESQQNTMRSENFHDYNHRRRFEEGDVEQSSDTESTAESACTATKASKDSFKTKQRRYDSDGASKVLSTNRQARAKSKRPCRRSRSDGWDSEYEQHESRRRKNSSSRRRKQHHISGGSTSRKSDVNYSKKLVTIISSNREKQGDNTVKTYKGHRERSMSSKEPQDLPTYQSATLKSPIGGTVMEMPIYSQATWAGPDSKLRKASNNRSKKTHQRPQSENTTSQKRNFIRKGNKKHTRASRKLSIGGGGRYFCEYGSLPVDLSKLPKDLVAKIGGQPDQLLEPIEQLNFDKLCRPLPTIKRTDGELSARRLVAEKLHLPPNHRDREVLSNTYEYPDSGLVMTDL